MAENNYIRLKDDEGTWHITNKDCCLVCSLCTHEQEAILRHGKCRGDKCEICGGEMVFHYWTDREDIVNEEAED